MNKKIVKNLFELRTAISKGFTVFFTSARDETKLVYAVKGETSTYYSDDEEQARKKEGFWVDLDRGTHVTIPFQRYFGYVDTIMFYVEDSGSFVELVEASYRARELPEPLFPELTQAWKDLQDGAMTTDAFELERKRILNG